MNTYFNTNSGRMTMKCTECDCVLDLCKDVDFKHCMRCTKQICCCATIHKPNNQNSILTFFHHTRTLFAAALGIEILCISAAEIGENSVFYFFWLPFTRNYSWIYHGIRSSRIYNVHDYLG